MKWRKLLERSTSSSPPESNRRAHRSIGRRATFEALENRKLFAADLVETDVVDGDVKEIQFDPEVPDMIRMMTFRGGDVTEGAGKSEELPTDLELDPLVLMTMTGAVDLEVADDSVVVELRTLETDLDLSITSLPVDDTAIIDRALSDEDLIFYTMSPGEAPIETTDVETTSLEVLAAEDVNGDGNVTALDLLLVINALNDFGALSTSQLAGLPESTGAVGWDINRDGFVTPLDALVLSDYFNGGNAAVDTVESAQDALIAPDLSRIRNPSEDESADERVDEPAPLIEDLSAL